MILALLATENTVNAEWNVAEAAERSSCPSSGHTLGAVKFPSSMKLLKQQGATAQNRGHMRGWSEALLRGWRDFSGSWTQTQGLGIAGVGLCERWRRSAAPTPPRRRRSTPGSWGQAPCTANKGHGGRRKDGPFQNCLFCFFSLVNIKIQNSERRSSMGLGSKNRQLAKKP